MSYQYISAQPGNSLRGSKSGGCDVRQIVSLLSQRAMAFFHTGRYSEALKEEEKGAALEPGNDRFLKNIDIIKEKLQEQSGRRQ